MKKLFLALMLFLSSIAFAAPQYGGTLVFGRGGDSSTIDPAHATDGESFYASTQVYDNLVQFKYGSTELEPALATSWDISKDGLEYVFHLRKGVMFHTTKFFKKKVEMTADDVVFSFKRQFDKTNPYIKIGGDYEYWSAMDMDKIVKDVVKVDKYTVKFTLLKPEAPFMANLAMDFASIVCKEFADDLLKAGKADDLNRLAVGTGPFVFEKWLKDDRMIFQANESYWGGKPYVKTLILKVIPNNSVRAAELKTGAIHIMDLPNPEEVAAMETDPKIKLIKQEGLNVGYLAMNENIKPFDNVKVRQAINYAINKAAIVDAVYAGFGKVAKSPIPPTMWSYNKNIKDYEYNPEKAKALLKEAGLENGFETDLWAMPVPRPYNPNGRKVAEAMQADLAKVGIKAKIVSYDWVTYLAKTKQGEHQMCLLGWTGDNADPDNFLYVLLSEAAAQLPAQNFAFWKNKEFNELINKAKVTSDVKERTALYEKAQVIFAEDAPWVTIANSVVVAPVLEKVNGFKLDPIGKRRFKDVWLAK
ncbi:MAG: ABC transporter substrate-binding protein [Sulfurospirillaceae bacterium]|nr:ABC transporter substrate-binding protein [Sulfurospirillaceae bacterium]MDD2826452.1 ABC transporter substrate-binding protein [Sulfurospirillaceae bacterium]